MSSPCVERRHQKTEGVPTETAGRGESGRGADLQRGDGLVRVHQVRHDGLQRAVPLAGGAGTRAGVRPELTHLLVVGLLAVMKVQQTAGRGVLQRRRGRSKASGVKHITSFQAKEILIKHH